MKNILSYILESDVIVFEDYYFVEFEYEPYLTSLYLLNGYCVTKKKNRLTLRFDKKSLDEATIDGNVVGIFDEKGKFRKLELMELTEKT